MARLTIPEPQIDLYEDGFAGHDQLERQPTADALSGLVDRIEDPMVIALDGGWGSGKSFFLKCWVGEHLKRDGNTTQTVYFDAFKHDFMDEPLVSLMACLLERFEELGPEEKSKLDKAKTIACKLAPAAIRIGASLATFGATNHLGDTGDVIAQAVGGEVKKSSDSFWREAQERQGVMENFRAALGELTVDEDGQTRKLVIVVDELDRCRPDYTLALLEIIKHFFSIPHVHFVLGVNLRELENSVKARYGGGINAGLYLQKFVTLTMGLPPQSAGGEHQTLLYFRKSAEDASLHKDIISGAILVLGCYKSKADLSLRDTQRFLTVLLIMPRSPTPIERHYEAFKLVTCCMALMKALRHDAYRKFSQVDMSMDGVKDIFSLKQNRDADEDHQSWVLNRAWSLFLAPETVERDSGWRGFDPQFPMREPKNALRSLISDYLEKIEIFVPEQP